MYILKKSEVPSIKKIKRNKGSTEKVSTFSGTRVEVSTALFVLI